MTALFICGPAGAGKDTVCEWFLDYGGRHAWSTSAWYLANIIDGWPMSRDDFVAIHGDNWRIVLAGMMWHYNCRDEPPCLLYREMVGAGCQVVNGIRRLSELRACIDAGLVREIWWIDASKRLKDRPPDTTLDYDLYDVAKVGVRFRVIDSNGTVEELIQNVQEVLSDGD